jgi:beta-glucosidase
MASFPENLKHAKTSFAVVALAITAAFAGCSAPQSANVISQSTLMQWEDSINSIISKMTLEEKVEMLHGKNMFSSAGVPRLGIADIEYADGPFGIREEMEPHGWNSAGLTTDSATYFPTGSALAATWSQEMAYDYGKAMGIEARLRGKDMMLGPAINIQRIPTGGRTYEYLSEDPVLSAALAVGYTRGMQEQGEAVCLKHYAVNNQENFRGHVDARVSPRALREIYLLPFQRAVEDGGAFGVMAAYNKVNGRWCSENYELENTILRQQWGFKGIVISDWGGTHSTVDALTAGLNVEMPGKTYLGEALLDSVKSGAVSDSVINERVRELLRVRLAIKPVPASEANKQMTSQPQQQHTAYEVAKRSIVMLKNNSLLPIDPTRVKRIAVIGAMATEKTAQGGVGAGVKALYEVTPLEGIRKAFEGKAEVVYAEGYKRFDREMRFKHQSPWQEPDDVLAGEAVKVATSADLVVFFAGTGREVETEGSDRESIMLPMGQEKVIERVAAANPNIVTVIVSGGPVDMREVEPLSKSLLMSWFNGSEGGNALADILAGKVSPSGKLPFSIPMTLEDNPAYSLGVYPQNTDSNGGDVFVNLVNRQKGDGAQAGPVADYKEDLLVGYRWYETKNVAVKYPFGHGLSYSAFEYSALSVKHEDNGDVRVTFSVKNTGNHDAEEVAQVYVSRPDSKILRPKKELKAFCRIAVAAGKSEKVDVTIDHRDLQHWDATSNDWQLESGAALISVGTSSADIRLNDDISL